MKEFPLRVTTPAKDGTNKVLWVTVNYLGRRKVKGPELNPEFVLRATATGAFGETVAYGPVSRTSVTTAGLIKKLTKTETAPDNAGTASSNAGKQSASN